MTSKFCVAAALVAGFAVWAMPAYAGFEWVPSNDGATYQPPASGTYGSPISSPPVATNVPEIVSPVVITGNAQPQPRPSLQTNSPAKEKVDLATATISVPAPSDTGVIQGFASQIPLPLALRQILPAGYSFSIDQDVSMDTSVSYSGGKSWRETLQEVLAPIGLVGREQGTTYTVSRASSPPSSSASLVQAPAAVPIDNSAIHSSPLASIAPPAALSPLVAREVSAPPAEVSSFNISSADSWSAERGDTLHRVLTDWCRRSNVELQWLAEYDYPIEASTHFNGGFEEAVRSLLVGFDGARPQPIGELHANATAGQKVLVVQARGNNYTN
jgi:hypothetical protein